MASIRRQVVIDADPDAVWDALRDWDALHERLAAGLVTDCLQDGTARIVMFASGASYGEEILGCDEQHRRSGVVDRRRSVHPSQRRRRGPRRAQRPYKLRVDVGPPSRRSG